MDKKGVGDRGGKQVDINSNEMEVRQHNIQSPVSVDSIEKKEGISSEEICNAEMPEVKEKTSHVDVKDLCVQESESSVLDVEVKSQAVEGNVVLENRFRSSDMPSPKFTRTLSARSVMSPFVETIVASRANELFTEGQDHEEKEEYTKALACYSKATVLKSDFTAVFIAKGELFLKLCDYQSAIIYYKKACITNPEDEDLFSRLAFVFFLQGQACFDIDDFSTALEYFSKSVDLKPDVWTYHTRSLACLIAQHRYKECFDLVNQKFDLDKCNPDLLIIRARLHRMFGNSTLAYYDTQDALKFDPDHIGANILMDELTKRADMFLKEARTMDLGGKMAKSLAKVSIAIEIDPTQGEFHSYRASLHRRQMDFNAAIEDLLIALDKADHDENHVVYQEVQRQLLLTYNDFSVECFRKGYFEEAITLLNKSLKINREEKTLYVNRGDCFYQTREIHFALSDYLQALEIAPRDPSILFRLSIIYNDLGIHEYQQKRYLEAEDFFSTAVNYQPTIPSYYLSRARARYMLDDFESACIDVISALHLNVDDKSVASLFVRLFPGKYRSEVISSEFGMLVKGALDSVIADINSEGTKESGGDAEGDAQQLTVAIPKKAPVARRTEAVKNKVAQKLQECMETRDFNINLIEKKKKVNDELESTLQEKSYLKPEWQHLKNVKIEFAQQQKTAVNLSMLSLDEGKRKKK